MRTRMRFSALALFAALCLSHTAFALDFSPWLLKGRFIVPGNYAVLDNDVLTFKYGQLEPGAYTGFDKVTYTSSSHAPWYDKRESIKERDMKRQAERERDE